MKTIINIKFFIPIACIFCALLFACGEENTWIEEVIEEKTITFDSKGGAPVPPSQTLDRGELVKKPEDPSLSGSIFGGWYKDIDCTEPYDFDFVPTHSMTLYAKWYDIETDDHSKLYPALEDFNITGAGKVAYYGYPRAVTVTALSGKTDSTDIIIYYLKVGETKKTNVIPTDLGTYQVTFDVKHTDTWNGAVGFEAGELVIQIQDANGFGIYLGKLAQNSPVAPAPINPYIIELYISDSNEFEDIRDELYSYNNTNKYIYLDFSGSTITEIPDSIQGYQGCSFLVGIAIPASVSTIGETSSILCGDNPNLKTINVDSGNSNYSSEGDVLYNKTKTTLLLYPAGKTDNSFTIPNNVNSIKSYAFYQCFKLSSVTIPVSVTSINAYAFYSCSSLLSVTFQCNITESNFPSEAFYGSGNLRSVYFGTNGGIGTYIKQGNAWTKQTSSP